MVNRHQQFRLIEKIALVQRFVRKVELCCQRWPIRWLIGGLDPHVNVARPPWIEAGGDRLELITALCVSELLPAKGISGVVVFPLSIGMPKLKSGPGNGLTVWWIAPGP
jgi:hypothetical protein